MNVGHVIISCALFSLPPLLLELYSKPSSAALSSTATPSPLPELYSNPSSAPLNPFSPTGALQQPLIRSTQLHSNPFSPTGALQQPLIRCLSSTVTPHLSSTARKTDKSKVTFKQCLPYKGKKRHTIGIIA